MSTWNQYIQQQKEITSVFRLDVYVGERGLLLCYLGNEQVYHQQYGLSFDLFHFPNS